MKNWYRAVCDKCRGAVYVMVSKYLSLIASIDEKDKAYLTEIHSEPEPCFNYPILRNRISTRNTIWDKPVEEPIDIVSRNDGSPIPFLSLSEAVACCV